jgi:cell division protein WhiA
MSGFTEDIRQELGHRLPHRRCCRRAALTAIAGLAGSLHLRGGEGGRATLRVDITTRSGATARAAFALAQTEMAGSAAPGRPEVLVHAPAGLRASSSYVVSIEGGAKWLATRLGLLDAGGRPRLLVPARVVAEDCDRRSYVQGALLAAGSCSSPGRSPHLEVSTSTRGMAATIAGLVGEVAGHRPGVSRTSGGWRVVLKSGQAIGDLLAAVGATDAYLVWEESRLRRQVRGVAARLANADAANVRRAAGAAASQVRTVERAVAAVGWDGLPPDLREVALARLANPEASLGEIGALCEPPIGKSAAHRRLARLADVAAARPAE